jgi:hypothetical protein
MRPKTVSFYKAVKKTAVKAYGLELQKKAIVVSKEGEKVN